MVLAKKKTQELTCALPPSHFAPVDCYDKGRRAVLEKGGVRWQEGGAACACALLSSPLPHVTAGLPISLTWGLRHSHNLSWKRLDAEISTFFKKNIASRRVSEISRHFSKIFWQDILSQNVSSWRYFSASLVHFYVHEDVVLSLQSSYR